MLSSISDLGKLNMYDYVDDIAQSNKKREYKIEFMNLNIRKSILCITLIMLIFTGQNLYCQNFSSFGCRESLIKYNEKDTAKVNLLNKTEKAPVNSNYDNVLRQSNEVLKLLNELNLYKNIPNNRFPNGYIYKNKYNLNQCLIYNNKLFKVLQNINIINHKKLSKPEKDTKNFLYIKEVKFQRTLTFFTILAFVLIVLLGIVIYTNRKNKKDSKNQKIRFTEVFNSLEEERKRITMDLHESLGQKLSTTKLYLSGLEEAVEQQNDQNKIFYREAVNLLDDSSNELRNISFNLMPGSLIKYGLKTAVDEIINKISESENINFNFGAEGFDNRINETLEINLYRIINESLVNIIKHSKATKIDIFLKYDSKQINLSISANGIGMNKQELSKNKELGFKSILSRVHILNGKAVIDTEINQGTILDITIPV